MLRPEPEAEMIARPIDITQSSQTTPDLASAETPLQRQILLWQRELLRRREAEMQASGEETQKGELRTEPQPEV
jgi:hypothetical protein